MKNIRLYKYTKADSFFNIFLSVFHIILEFSVHKDVQTTTKKDSF